MGLATSQIRIEFLTLYRDDLEYKVQLLTQTKLQLAAGETSAMSAGTDLDPDSPEMKFLNQRVAKLQQIEKQLDASLERYKTQLQAVDTEIESAHKFVENDIRRSFSYGGGEGR
jgi:hypothetical protein